VSRTQSDRGARTIRTVGPRGRVARVWLEGQERVRDVAGEDRVPRGVGPASDADDGMQTVVDMVREQGPGHRRPHHGA